ncbi:MarR family winged helix-turn-helix transcriptional regulator [Methylobacterium sp. P5_C11]
MSAIDRVASEFGEVGQRLHRLLDARMTKQGASLAQNKLLCFLQRAEQDVCATDIAGYYGLAPRTVTQALDLLERDGLVTRRPDPSDRRVKRVSITAAGLRAMRASEPMRREFVEQIFGVLNQDEMTGFSHALSRLSQALNEAERTEPR